MNVTYTVPVYTIINRINFSRVCKSSKQDVSLIHPVFLSKFFLWYCAYFIGIRQLWLDGMKSLTEI